MPVTSTHRPPLPGSRDQEDRPGVRNVKVRRARQARLVGSATGCSHCGAIAYATIGEAPTQGGVLAAAPLGNVTADVGPGDGLPIGIAALDGPIGTEGVAFTAVDGVPALHPTTTKAATRSRTHRRRGTYRLGIAFLTRSYFPRARRPRTLGFVERGVTATRPLTVLRTRPRAQGRLTMDQRCALERRAGSSLGRRGACRPRRSTRRSADPGRPTHRGC